MSLLILSAVLGAVALALAMQLRRLGRRLEALPAAREALSATEARLGALQESWSALQATEAAQRRELQAAGATCATLEAEKRALAERLATRQQELDEQQDRLRTEFQNLANTILEEKSKKFTQMNREGLEGLLKPLGENLDNFRKRVDEVYDKESKERFSLAREVKTLAELSGKLDDGARELALALRGDSKVQGDWGQMVLETILERAGLRRGEEFFAQEFLRDEAGKVLHNEAGRGMQPDITIRYPDGRELLVDAKVSLTAYTIWANSSEPGEREQAAAEHLRSLRAHVDELAKKNYSDHAATLDAVVLFVPTEPAYHLALRLDPGLWAHAYDKRVLLVSPTNLLAVVRLVGDLWKRDRQERHALDIADRGARLYDKFVTFSGNLLEIGENLDRARKSYDQSLGQLKDGPGNLVSQAEKLRELGVKAKKRLPEALARESLPEAQEESGSERLII